MKNEAVGWYHPKAGELAQQVVDVLNCISSLIRDRIGIRTICVFGIQDQDSCSLLKWYPSTVIGTHHSVHQSL